MLSVVLDGLNGILITYVPVKNRGYDASLSLSVSLLFCACHEPAGLEPQLANLESEISSLTVGTCPGQQDKIVTTSYYGHSPADISMPLTPLDVTRAAAVEWASAPNSYCRPWPCPGVAAVAWVNKQTNYVSIRLYNAWSKQFVGSTINFLLASPRGWIQHIGNDKACSILGGGQCAWFATQAESIGLTPYSTVELLAVNSSGSSGWTGGWQGMDPSGEYAIFNGVHRKMVAYITPGRGQVRAKFFDTQMAEIGDVLVWDLVDPALAYQTVSAFQKEDGTWLVAWTEVDSQVTHMARVRHRTISWSYVMGSPPNSYNPVSLCAGGDCGGGAAREGSESAVAQPNAPMMGICTCKNLYLASSNFSTTQSDRYRLYTYGYPHMVRLSSAGIPTGGANYPAGTYSPITELGRMTTDLGTAIYQRLVNNTGFQSARMEYYVEGSEAVVSQADVLSAPGAEDFRAEPRYVAVGIASTAPKDASGASTLKLSVMPTRAAGCPP